MAIAPAVPKDNRTKTPEEKNREEAMKELGEKMEKQLPPILGQANEPANSEVPWAKRRHWPDRHIKKLPQMQGKQLEELGGKQPITRYDLPEKEGKIVERLSASEGYSDKQDPKSENYVHRSISSNKDTIEITLHEIGTSENTVYRIDRKTGTVREYKTDAKGVIKDAREYTGENFEKELRYREEGENLHYTQPWPNPNIIDPDMFKPTPRMEGVSTHGIPSWEGDSTRGKDHPELVGKTEELSKGGKDHTQDSFPEKEVAGKLDGLYGEDIVVFGGLRNTPDGQVKPVAAGRNIRYSETDDYFEMSFVNEERVYRINKETGNVTELLKQDGTIVAAREYTKEEFNKELDDRLKRKAEHEESNKPLPPVNF